MLKAILDTKEGRKMLMLVLERTNIDHFINGHPMHLFAEEMGSINFNINEILICFFETKEDALKYFINHGIITGDTQIHHDKEVN